MSGSIIQIINQCLAVWKKYKGDLRYRIAVIFVRTGSAMMMGGGFSIFFKLIIPGFGDEPLLLDFDLGGVGLIIFSIGFITFLLGCFLLMRRYRQLDQADVARGSVLLFYRGFPNSNPSLPRDALPKEKAAFVSPLNIDYIDSRDPASICREYPGVHQSIMRRMEHPEATEAFVATLGSVPSLYVIGATLRDGHLPIVYMDHYRERNEWVILDEVGRPVEPVFSYRDNETYSDIQKEISKLEQGPVGVAVSFSMEILDSELPPALVGRVIHVSLPFECKYDALPCEAVQASVAKKVAHLLTGLNKISTEIHLFLCAQASFITRLGALHQDGMMGKVVIHNYNPGMKQYDWALEFNAAKVALWKSDWSEILN